MTLVKFFDHRRKEEVWVNPEAVLSARTGQWPGTPAKTELEVRGNQGYGNHGFFVTEPPEEVAKMLMNPKTKKGRPT